MKTIAEQVLLKHSLEGASIDRLAMELGAEEIQHASSTVYVYDDNSYTEVFSNKQHQSGSSYESLEICLYPDIDIQYEGGCKITKIAEEPAPIKPLSTGHNKAILLYCTKKYNEKVHKQIAENLKASVFPTSPSESEKPTIQNRTPQVQCKCGE